MEINCDWDPNQSKDYEREIMCRSRINKRKIRAKGTSHSRQTNSVNDAAGVETPPVRGFPSTGNVAQYDWRRLEHIYDRVVACEKRLDAAHAAKFVKLPREGNARFGNL